MQKNRHTNVAESTFATTLQLQRWCMRILAPAQAKINAEIEKLSPETWGNEDRAGHHAQSGMLAIVW